MQLLDDHPGYQRFRIAPQPGGGLTWAEAVHDSPYGRIESSWRIEGESFRLTVVVPPGTTAEVLLPDGTRTRADAGDRVLRVLAQCSRSGGVTCARGEEIDQRVDEVVRREAAVRTVLQL